MAAYVFFDGVSVHPERMTGYREKAFASVKAFNGKVVANTNNIDCREGDWHPTKIVMLEFPSMEKARAWYEPPEYQEVLPIRLDANRERGSNHMAVEARPGRPKRSKEEKHGTAL